MSKILVVDPKKCVGCRLCEVACSLVKTGRVNPSQARIAVTIFDEEGFYMPVVCYQCTEAWCKAACPAAAIEKDEKLRRYIVNEERCVGCRICNAACPFGTISFSQKTGKAFKCDLCDGEPTCVAYCPTGALRYEERDATLLSRRTATARKTMDAFTAER
ncbi:MAG: 4Fe-4S dicluster domain-containing protein [Chloroflexi bacterium]|nr:4Fe-4S dicluster domain-containing protein [Chloroflexota bacterium]